MDGVEGVALEAHSALLYSIGPALKAACRDELSTSSLAVALRLLFPSPSFVSCQLSITPRLCVSVSNVAQLGGCTLSLLDAHGSLAGRVIESAVPMSSCVAIDRCHRLVDVEYAASSTAEPLLRLTCIPLLHGLAAEVPALASAAAEGGLDALWAEYETRCRGLPCIGCITVSSFGHEAVGGASSSPDRIASNLLLLAAVAAPDVLLGGQRAVLNMAALLGLLCMRHPYHYEPGRGIVPQDTVPAEPQQEGGEFSTSERQRALRPPPPSAAEAAEAGKPVAVSSGGDCRSQRCLMAAPVPPMAVPSTGMAGSTNKPAKPWAAAAAAGAADNPLSASSQMQQQQQQQQDQHQQQPSMVASVGPCGIPGSSSSSSSSSSDSPFGKSFCSDASEPSSLTANEEEADATSCKFGGVSLAVLAAEVDAGGLAQHLLLQTFCSPLIEGCWHGVARGHTWKVMRVLAPVMYTLFIIKLAVQYPFEWLYYHPKQLAVQCLVGIISVIYTYRVHTSVRVAEVMSACHWVVIRALHATLMYQWALPRVLANGAPTHHLAHLLYAMLGSSIITPMLFEVRWALWAFLLPATAAAWVTMVPSSMQLLLNLRCLPGHLHLVLAYAVVLLATVAIPARLLYDRERSSRDTFRLLLLRQLQVARSSSSST